MNTQEAINYSIFYLHAIIYVAFDQLKLFSFLIQGKDFNVVSFIICFIVL